MSNSQEVRPETIKQQQATSKQPGIGIIATENNSEQVARTILRANNQGYPVLVTSADSPHIEAVTFAEQLDATVVLPSEHPETEDLKAILTEAAQSLGLPGLILQTEASSRIDYQQSHNQLTQSQYIVEAESVSTPTVETTTASGEQSVAAIIPAYNEAETIPEIITATSPYVDNVIVINDASTDNTVELASEYADHVVTHPKNMGVGGAVHTGYQAAIRSNHDIVIQIDGDGQHDPSYIPEMLETMDNRDADMVIGSRWLNDSYQDYSLIRRAGIKFFTAEVNLLGKLDITDVTSGFRAYRTSMLDDLGRPENSHWALEQTLEAARKDYNIEEISVPMPPATEGSQFDLGTFAKYPPRMVLTTLKTLLLR